MIKLVGKAYKKITITGFSVLKKIVKRYIISCRGMKDIVFKDSH